MIGKINNNELSVLECTLTEELKNKGYKNIIEINKAEDVTIDSYHYISYKYHELIDKIELEYIAKADDIEITLTIHNCNKTLSSTDYIIQKFAEYNLNPTLEARKALKLDKYDIAVVIKERQELRNKVNELRKLIK